MFRRHGRTAIHCPMVLKHPTLGELDVVTSNISASGIFVAASQFDSDAAALLPLRIGDLLETEVESVDAEAERIQLKVIRQSTEGFGLAFIHL